MGAFSALADLLGLLLGMALILSSLAFADWRLAIAGTLLIMLALMPTSGGAR